MLSYVSRPLPPGRPCLPLDQLPVDTQIAIAELAVADARPPKYLTSRTCQTSSRAWYEWHWHRGIDPDRRRVRIPTAVRERIIARDGYICGLCGGDVAPDDVHIDHIIPVVHGGTNADKNLQVTHSLCNARKGSKTA